MTREIHSSDQFVRLAIEALPELGSVVDKEINEWVPSLVPGTILYAAIGAHIAKTERTILERSGMFDLVERGMLNASKHVATWVAKNGARAPFRFDEVPSEQDMGEIRIYLQQRRVWGGSPKFQQAIAAQLGRFTEVRPAHRPRKAVLTAAVEK
jgi:hypothetical protein